MLPAKVLQQWYLLHLGSPEMCCSPTPSSPSFLALFLFNAVSMDAVVTLQREKMVHKIRWYLGGGGVHLALPLAPPKLLWKFQGGNTHDVVFFWVGSQNNDRDSQLSKNYGSSLFTPALLNQLILLPCKNFKTFQALPNECIKSVSIISIATLKMSSKKCLNGQITTYHPHPVTPPSKKKQWSSKHLELPTWITRPCWCGLSQSIHTTRWSGCGQTEALAGSNFKFSTFSSRLP